MSKFKVEVTCTDRIYYEVDAETVSDVHTQLEDEGRIPESWKIITENWGTEEIASVRKLD